jgi:hypothetical protein
MKSIYSWIFLRRNELVLSALPQLIGLPVFLIAIRVADSSLISLRLPAYQAGSSIASLILLGFSYSSSKQIPTSSVYWTITVPSAFSYAIIYQLSHAKISDLAISIILFITIINISFLQSTQLALHGVRPFQILNVFISAFLPLLLIIPVYLLPLVLLLTAVYNLVTFSANISLHPNKPAISRPFKSLIAQVPFLTYSIFDPLLITIIGSYSYEQYVSITKMSFGITNLIFAYSQYKILASSFDLLLSFRFSTVVFASLVGILLTFFLPETPSLLLLSFLLPIAINLSSIVLRASLKLQIVTRLDLCIVNISSLAYLGVLLVLRNVPRSYNTLPIVIGSLVIIFYSILLIFKFRVLSTIATKQ